MGEFVWRTPLCQEDTLLYHTQPTPSSHSRMFDEWNSSFTPKPSDPPYTPFSSDATPILHPFVTGVIRANNRDLETACLQLITGHSFQADYSDRFRTRANDNTICPRCTGRYTTRHVLLHCRPLASIRTRTIASYSLTRLFRSTHGAKKLIHFLHATQALLRPLPPRPDPP